MVVPDSWSNFSSGSEADDEYLGPGGLTDDNGDFIVAGNAVNDLNGYIRQGLAVPHNWDQFKQRTYVDLDWLFADMITACKDLFAAFDKIYNTAASLKQCIQDMDDVCDRIHGAALYSGHRLDAVAKLLKDAEIYTAHSHARSLILWDAKKQVDNMDKDWVAIGSKARQLAYDLDKYPSILLNYNAELGLVRKRFEDALAKPVGIWDIGKVLIRDLLHLPETLGTAMDRTISSLPKVVNDIQMIEGPWRDIADDIKDLSKRIETDANNLGSIGRGIEKRKLTDKWVKTANAVQAFQRAYTGGGWWGGGEGHWFDWAAWFGNLLDLLSKAVEGWRKLEGNHKK